MARSLLEGDIKIVKYIERHKLPGRRKPFLEIERNDHVFWGNAQITGTYG